MIKYLGSKRLLLPEILDAVRSFHNVRTVTDLFSGTARVGHALKEQGYRVISNDINAYAACLARCYVVADRTALLPEATRLIEELNTLRGYPGWFSDIYATRSRYFQPHNAERIQAIRDAIDELAPEEPLRSVLLVSLMEAADRVDSTTGVQMAYLKQWAKRSSNHLELRVPRMLPLTEAGTCEAMQLDARDAAARIDADLAYLDPPYNQHKYLGNYHIWETLVRWDRPEVYGVACKRVDVRARKSPYNSKPGCLPAMTELLNATRAPNVLISFSDEGYISRHQMETLLATQGAVSVREFEYKRYVGARIGIHNREGKRVGRISHTENREYLYLLRRG